jgi:P-type Cu+ transporter
MKNKEIQINGMDCAECASHVQKALSNLPQIESALVLLGAEKAIIQFEDEPPTNPEIIHAVAEAGYEAVLDEDKIENHASTKNAGDFGNASILSFIVIVLFILAITFLGEQLGVFNRLQMIIPWFVWLGLILIGGLPIFQNVVRALLRKQVISHTLMSVSVFTAIAVGEWATALMIVLFMRLGDLIERQTTEKARQSVRKLARLAPEKARVIRGDEEIDLPINDIEHGNIVIIRPGESIPIDGKVIEGHASVDQSAISGESMPVEVTEGSDVFAATLLLNGMVKVKTSAVGSETTFGKIIKMVEEAEANRGAFQQLADKFSGYYLPIVALIAVGTYLISKDPIAAAAVMVVACSCSFSLATPVAMLASIGSAAKQGLLFKGGKYIESLSKADSVFIDKTGTLTIGKPVITDVIPIGSFSEITLIQLTASAERYSEHPLAQAVLRKAETFGVSLLPSIAFSNIPGQGIHAEIDGKLIVVSNTPATMDGEAAHISEQLRKEGKTLLFVQIDGKDAGVLAAEDILREDTVQAIRHLRALGIGSIKLISGDHPAAVEKIANKLGIDFKGSMSPEDKIQAVMTSQAIGQHVVMIGDGINDAPALAQADVGIAMGHTGSDIAIETAHVALLREDWNLIPEAFLIAKRTMQVVRMNFLFTGFYNLIGLSLAAAGLLPPAIAAAMQSIPDVGIMTNSARLLYKRRPEENDFKKDKSNF